MPETSMRRALIAVALVIVLIVVLVLPLGSVPAPSAQPSAPLPIKIGYQAVASWLLFGARSLKLYEKAGLAPIFVKFTAGAPMIAAAQSQSIDVAMVGTVPFLAGVVGLTVNYAAYMSEVYRSGIQAIPRGQLDAAAALGMRASLAMRRIVLPQAIRIVIPVLGNYFVSLFKDTSLTSALTIQELLFSGQIIAARTYNYFTIYTLVFLVGYPASRFVRYLERISKRGYSRKRKVTTPLEPEPLPAAIESGRSIK